MPQFHTFSSNFAVRNAFNGALTNATQNGAGVDTLGFRRAALAVSATTGAATTFNFTVSDSPDNSVWTVVAGATLGSAIVASTANYDQVVDIDLAKRQRYLRVNVVGTGAAGQAGAVFLLGQPILSAPTQDNAAISV